MSEDYSADLQKLYLEFLLADKDLFVRCNAILKSNYFDRQFRDTVDFNTPSNNIQISNSNSHDVFVLKINTNGTPMWVNTFGGKETDQAQSIGLNKFQKCMII